MVSLSLKPTHLARYRDVARLFIKYGRGDVLAYSPDDPALDEPAGPDRIAGSRQAARADELTADLESLGPTFVKLGQMLSTRADLLPPAYLDALSRLQDDVEPFPYAEVEKIVTQEIGAKLSRAFSEFDHKPLAAASLGQVHRAKLRDGRAVAVKVQRPGVRERVQTDLDALAEIADFLEKHSATARQYEFGRVLQELRESLLAELDYRKEAKNLSVVGRNLAQFRRIVVPQPVDDYTTSRVLTMEYISGRKVTDLSPVALLEIDGRELAEELSRAYLKQMLVDGLFHADPHPGNLHLDDEKRLVLLDLGMVARIPPRMQEQLIKLLLAISEGRGEDAARLALEVGERREEHNESEFLRRGAALVSRYQDARLEDIQAGRIVMELQSIAAESGIRLPREFTMIGKALLNLDVVSRTLDPKFNPTESIRRNASDILQKRMRKKVTLGSMFNSMLEASEFAQRLPERLNRIMELAANNQLRMRVDTINEKELIQGLQKIANRITMGLVLAALIIGAALIMRVPASFTLLGYPALATVLFLAAAVGGVWLLITILRSDR